MKKFIIWIAIVWAVGFAAVPALESWDMGSIDTIGSDQIERIEE